MLNIQSLEQTQQALTMSVELNGGIDAALSACDRMYSALFIDRVLTVGEYNKEAKFSGYNSVCCTSLLLELALPLYCKEFNTSIGECPTEEHGQDGYYYAMEALEDNALAWFKKEHPTFKVVDDTKIVTFCNYKGEGEDEIGLYILNKHLPTFKSKNESFNQVNY